MQKSRFAAQTMAAIGRPGRLRGAEWQRRLVTRLHTGFSTIRQPALKLTERSPRISRHGLTPLTGILPDGTSTIREPKCWPISRLIRDGLSPWADWAGKSATSVKRLSVRQLA